MYGGGGGVHRTVLLNQPFSQIDYETVATTDFTPLKYSAEITRPCHLWQTARPPPSPTATLCAWGKAGSLTRVATLARLLGDGGDVHSAPPVQLCKATTLYSSV